MKLVTTLIAATLALGLTGCGEKEGNQEQDVIDNNPPTGSPDSMVGSNDGRNRIERRDQNNCPINQFIGDAGEPGYRIAGVKLSQVYEVDAESSDGKIIGNKNTLIKVELVSKNPNETVAMPKDGLVSISSEGRCRYLVLSSASENVAQTVTPGSLDTHLFGLISKDEIKEGVVMQVAVGRNTPHKRADADALFKRVMPKVEAPIVAKGIIVPIRYDGSSNRGLLGRIVNDNADLFGRFLTRALPFSEASFTIDAPVKLNALENPGIFNQPTQTSDGRLIFNVRAIERALNEADQVCDSRIGSSSQKCIFVFPPQLVFSNTGGQSFVSGIAFVGGRTTVTSSVLAYDNPSVTRPGNQPWLTFPAETMIHEIGHLYSLEHANCGVNGTTDPRLDSNGSMGRTAGFDIGRGFYFANRTTDPQVRFSDIMGYCITGWMSKAGHDIILEEARKQTSVAARKVTKASRIDGKWTVTEGYATTSAKKANDSFLPAILKPLSNAIFQYEVDHGEPTDDLYLIIDAPFDLVRTILGVVAG